MGVYLGSRYSPYTTERYFALNESDTLDIRERISFSEDNGQYYQFVDGDTIDGIAYKYYGDATYWWAIMDANPDYVMESEIPLGAMLFLPSKEEIESVLEY